MNFDGAILQILQPSFFYSIIFLVAAFVCVKVFTRFCSLSISERTKSLLHIVPLLVPLLVMAVFLPSFTFQSNVADIRVGTPLMATEPMTLHSVGSYNLHYSSPLNLHMVMPVAKPLSPPIGDGFLVTNSQVSTMSVTGILCIIGLIVGTLFALSMIIADDRIARRILRVIPLSSGEQSWLQATVAVSSKKLGIACPKIGLVEDLRPNAFTIGYGRGATVVFSLGILELLSKEELTAVTLHELAHVKHNDFFFKTLTSALVAISFFNPLAFITASAAQRQREMFADEGAIAFLERPSMLSSALTKICNSIKTLPPAGVFDRTSNSIFVTSSVLYRSGILATHPRLDRRLRNISQHGSGVRLNRKIVSHAMLLSLVLVSLFVLTSYAIVELQHVCYDSNNKGPVELVGNRVHGGVLAGERLSEEVMLTSQGGIFPVSADNVQFGGGFVLRQSGGSNVNTMLPVPSPFLRSMR